MIRLAILLASATALQCELAVSLGDFDFVSTFPVEADLRVWSSFLVERIAERTGEAFDEAARVRVLENMEAARQDCARRPSACAVPRPRGDELVRPSRRECKVLVTGSGRSGTTFLMKLFTALGLETGFDSATIAAHIDGASGGGLESGFNSLMNASLLASTPKVVKINAAELDTIGFPPETQGELAGRLELVIVPFRELYEVVESRARNGGGWGGLYTRFYSAGREMLERELEAGGEELELNYRMETQLFARLALFLLDWDIPHVFVSYRRMIAEPTYLYDALLPLMRAHGVSFEAFAAEYAEVRDDREPRPLSDTHRSALRESVVVRPRASAS